MVGVYMCVLFLDIVKLYVEVYMDLGEKLVSMKYFVDE